MKSRKRWLLALILAVGVAIGTSVWGEEYDHVLVPVSPQATPGARGSYWTSVLRVRNDGDSFVLTDQSPDLPCVLAACPTPTAQPHATQPLLPLWAPYKDGALIYVERPGIESITFHLRVWDLSRESQTWGTEVPVVREADTFAGAFTLLEIPTDARFRSLLRIYDFDGVDRTVVRMRVYPLDESVLLGEKEIVLRVYAEDPPPDSLSAFAEYPASERVDLVHEFPQVLAYDELRVVIEPVTEGARIWAFVSVVNNETQHLTVITPDN